MPIFDIELVLKPEEVLPRDLAQQLADTLGEFYQAPPGEVWVRLHPVSDERYAENQVLQQVYPVFVTVLKSRGAGIPELSEEALALAQRIASVCDRPYENVHILYQPPAIGRIAFGGRLLTRND